MSDLIKIVICTALVSFLFFVGDVHTYAFTISGKLITNSQSDEIDSQHLGPDSRDQSRSGLASRSETDDIRVSISYSVFNRDGTAQLIAVEKHFTEGFTEFGGNLNEPTPVNIAVAVGAEEPLTLRTVIEPDDEFLFEFVDNPGSKPDKLTAIGTLRLYEDPDKKFTISGDLSSMNLELSSVVVEVLAWDYDPATGDVNDVLFGRVKPNEGRFVFEGQVREPVVAVVVVAVGRAYTQFQAIVEPNADLSVSARGTLYTLGARSKSGRHARLVDSWRTSSEYIRLMDEYDAAHQDYYRKSEEQSVVLKSNDDKESSLSEANGNSPKIDAELSSSTSSEKSGSKNTDTESMSDSNGSLLRQDEGCEHVEVEEVKTQGIADSNEETLPLHQQLSLQMERIRAEAIEYIATNAEEPIDKLLALEMDAYWGSEQALPIYDNLAATLDVDIVGRRVTHARNDHARFLETQGIGKSLSEGRKAPEFSLPNLQGQYVALGDLVAENEILLLDFWASWCGPCIESFPALKQVYDTYKDDGFEIVSISLDTTSEAWKRSSTEHELTWIDLGQKEGFEGVVAKSYGVTSIPKGYLVDSTGCIIQKDLSPGRLEELLAARFGK